MVLYHFFSIFLQDMLYYNFPNIIMQAPGLRGRDFDKQGRPDEVDVPLLHPKRVGGTLSESYRAPDIY